jgi:hypothetical protein
MRPFRILLLSAIGLAGAPGLSGPATAEDMPTFKVELKDGTIAPTRLEVPANKPFRIEVSNTGSTPAEFESTSLHREKVLAAGGTASVVFRRLKVGEYDVFDDLHREARGTLVAK